MMQRNRFIKALEDTIAETKRNVNDDEYTKRFPHPNRKIKELRDRVRTLEELLVFARFLHRFQIKEH